MNKSPDYSSQSEINQVFKVLSALEEQVDDFEQNSIEQSFEEQSILTMSSLGKFGRFGNQLFQYAFLRICAIQSGAEIECPSWIGQSLFGHADLPITHRLPPAIESRSHTKTLYDVIPEFIPYIEKLGQGKHCRISQEALIEGAKNLDLWGFFQFHTQLYAPYKTFFQSLFQPVDELRLQLEAGLARLQSQGKTIVGIHLRRGDFVSLPLAGFTLVTPLNWWVDWLRKHWSEWDRPVLFVCSDDLDNVLPAFVEFTPVTSQDLQIKLPESMQSGDIDFYIDFFMLTQCDVLGISNSIFSFAASMLNNKAKLFVRPSWDFSIKLIPFSPWDSEPLLYIGNEQPQFYKSFVQTLKVSYLTQGSGGMLKCLFFYMPLNLLRKWLIRFYLAYQAQKWKGISKALLYSLGFHSIWQNT